MALILIALYRMAPTDIKELKNQREELLEKRFIRPLHGLISVKWDGPELGIPDLPLASEYMIF